MYTGDNEEERHNYEPKTNNEGRRVDTPAQAQKLVNDADWIIPFGKKHKGKRLGDIPKNELFGFIDWLEKQPNINPDAKELIERSERLHGV